MKIERAADRHSLGAPMFLRLIAVVHFASPAFAQGAGGDIAIKDIIPHGRAGMETCFAGSFTNKTIDMKQWPTYAEQIQPATDASGKLIAPARMQGRPNQSISDVALYLYSTNGRSSDESWDFTFTVRAISPSIGQELFTRSGCEWSGWDFEKQQHVEPEFMLACSIDCDGGGMRAKRIPGTKSVNLIFDRLKMQSGCEGGGLYSLGESDAKVEFRLDPVSIGACKSLKAWDRD